MQIYLPVSSIDRAALAALLIVCLAGVAFILSWLPVRSASSPSKLEQEEEEETHLVKLFTTLEIKQRALSCGRPECEGAPRSCSHYMVLLSYLEDFLAKPHDDVGRAGPVCPFVPLSLKKQTLLVGMLRTPQVNAEAYMEEMVQLMRGLRGHFLQLAPVNGRLKLYKAIVVGFPDISDADAPCLIDSVQRRLKAEFTECGMMIGEFHRLNKTPGLWNPDFCPLQTPIPALAIRFMVPTDVLFLKHDAAYLRAYLSTIPDVQSNASYRAEAKQALMDIDGTQ